MQQLANISDYQEIVFGDPENSCLLNFQNTDNQYRYSHKITLNYTGKELDAETGYSYFGARYLDHTLITAWLSVDPMADKYPSLSPYAYCAWNPVKLVDPDGRTIWLGDHNSHYKSRYDPNQKYAEGTLGHKLNKIYHNSKAGKFVISSLINTRKNYYISNSEDPTGDGNPCFSPNDQQIYLNSDKHGGTEGTIAHELFHLFQYHNKQKGRTIDGEVEAFIFEGIVLTQMYGKSFNPIKHDQGYIDANRPINSISREGKMYKQKMQSLRTNFSEKNLDYVVNYFMNNTIEGERYRGKGYSFSSQGPNHSASKSLLKRIAKNIY